MPLWTGAVSIPRSVFSETGGFKPHLKLGEDFDLWIRIALSHKVAFLDEPLAFYFQDSNPVWRGTGHLTDPKVHMLWNLDYLSEEEKKNPDYKQLIDRIRVYNLHKYLLNPCYRYAARQELSKIDWSQQSIKTRRLYQLPIWLLVIRNYLLSTGSYIKQMMRKI